MRHTSAAPAGLGGQSAVTTQLAMHRSPIIVGAHTHDAHARRHGRAVTRRTRRVDERGVGRGAVGRGAIGVRAIGGRAIGRRVARVGADRDGAIDARAQGDDDER
jgi:hypothetical protein